MKQQIIGSIGNIVNMQNIFCDSGNTFVSLYSKLILHGIDKTITQFISGNINHFSILVKGLF